MNNDRQNRFDPTYYQRYANRNQKKIKAILRNVGESETLLDIGCNQGYILRAFLEQNLIKHGAGIDMDISVIDPWLIEDKRFSFFEGNILDYVFDRSYETIVFNSVFHHIFGTYGKETALGLWDNIIDHCDRVLIFETGVLTEFGQYYWMENFLRYYSTDEEILNVLLQRIGSRLKKCESIVSLPIHLTRRNVYKIELFPVNSPYNLKQNENDFYAAHISKDENWDVINEYMRTSGSKDQKLIETGKETSANTRLFNETKFYLLRSKKDGRHFFAKKILDDPYKRMREYFFLTSANHHWIIKLIAVHPKYGFIFPFHDWRKLGQLSLRGIKNVSSFATEVKLFFDWASQERLSPGILDLSPETRGTSRPLIDMVDFHLNNFLVKVEGNAIKDWTVIDLEYAFNHGSSRNYRYLYGFLTRVAPWNFKYPILFGRYYFRGYSQNISMAKNILVRYCYSLLASICYAIKRFIGLKKASKK
jgi:uncharacterized protein YrzB (UPF0473 family)